MQISHDPPYSTNRNHFEGLVAIAKVMSYAKENSSVRKVPCVWILLARLPISLGLKLVSLGAFGNRPLLPCGKLANNCTAQRSPSLSEDGDSDLYGVILTSNSQSNE